MFFSTWGLFAFFKVSGLHGFTCVIQPSDWAELGALMQVLQKSVQHMAAQTLWPKTWR